MELDLNKVIQTYVLLNLSVLSSTGPSYVTVVGAIWRSRVIKSLDLYPKHVTITDGREFREVIP